MAIRGWAAGMKSIKFTDIKDYRGKINTKKWYHEYVWRNNVTIMEFVSEKNIGKHVPKFTEDTCSKKAVTFFLAT